MDVLLISLLIFLVLGIPIAYSLGLSAFCYFIVYHSELLLILPQRFFSGLNLYALIALPLFILMGLLMNESGITKRLIDFSLLFVGKLRGGLGLVNVIASMVFGGISGEILKKFVKNAKIRKNFVTLFNLVALISSTAWIIRKIT